MDASLFLLFGRARYLVHDALHNALESRKSHPLHLRGIVRQTGLSVSAVQYELRLLDQLGMIADVGTPTRPLYVLDRNHELFKLLHAMFATSKRNGSQKLSSADREHFARKRVRQLSDRALNPKQTSTFIARGAALRKSVNVE